MTKSSPPHNEQRDDAPLDQIEPPIRGELLGVSDISHPSDPPDASQATGREPRDRQIFLSDASAETGRLLVALQTKGYSVVDVPLGLLLSRCRHELPEVIICDADAHEAESKLFELRSLQLDDVRLVLLGQPDGALHRKPDLKQLAHEAFFRPIDVDAVVERIAGLCSPPRKRSYRPRVGRPGLMPRLVASARKPYRSDTTPFEMSGLPYEREEPSDPDWPTDSPPSRGPLLSDAPPISQRSSGVPPVRSVAPSAPSLQRAPLSEETEAVLERGRRRLEAYPRQSARPVRLSVGVHSLAGDLRPELLAALQEPLDDAEYGFRSEDEHPDSTSPGTRSHVEGAMRHDYSGFGSAPPASVLTGETRRPTSAERYGTSTSTGTGETEEKTNPGGRATQPPPEAEVEHRVEETSIAMDDLSDLLSSPWGSPAPQLDTFEPPPPDLPQTSLISTEPPRRGSLRTHVQVPAEPDPPDLSESDFFAAPPIPSSLLSRNASRAPGVTRNQPPVPGSRMSEKGESPGPTGVLSAMLARAIRERFSGAIAQQDSAGVRRVMVTDGDIGTVISSIASESLAHFLHARGDLSREILSTLTAIPAFGRHAGAALIARGLLQQEDLWPVLRAHAEWTLARALASTSLCVREDNVPPRLLEEPAVFGGAAGTETYLDVVRRVVTPDQALAALGGGERVLGQGVANSLLAEAALSAKDQQAVLDALGKPLEPIKNRDARLLPILFGLTQLGVLTVGGGQLATPALDVQRRSKQLDEDAFVANLLARRALAEDGDYFAVLGIARSATAYEVDRAKDELLAIYSEDRLSANTAHLRADLLMVRTTIYEAHLVLHDDVRRFRYRTALEAMPG